MAYNPDKLKELGIPAGIFDLTLNDLTHTQETDEKKIPVKSARAFYEKYSKKRFAPRDAGKVHLVNFLFHAYQETTAKIDKSYFDEYGLRSRIQAPEDMQYYDSFYDLTEWLRSLFENAVAIRKDLVLCLSEFDGIAHSLLSAENIRNSIQGDQSAELVLWLNTTTLEAYTPQEPGGLLLQSIRDSIGQDIRYLRAYHTFLDEIAAITGIPECAILKMNLVPVTRRLAALNVALKYIRDDVAEHREPEIREAEASAAPDAGKVPQTLPYLKLTTTNWTLDYLSATLEYFKPIGEEEPVPRDRLSYLRDTLRRDFKKTFINWYLLYHEYSMDYRQPGNTIIPPEPFVDVELAEAKAHEG